MVETIGAFINEWKPAKTTRTYLQQYLVMDGKLSDDLDLQPTLGNETYLHELSHHFLRLDKVMQTEETALVNLVFGNVQSGKTSHLRSNICWARDSGFDLIVLLTGSVLDLGAQTVSTLDTQLPVNTIKLFEVPAIGRLDETTVSQILSSINLRISASASPIPVISLIKSPKRLESVKEIVERIARSNLRDLKVCFLDDEADQVSPDPDASKRIEEISDLVPSTKLRISVHKRINRVREAVRGRHIYLAYTATPQALFLGDLNSTMQPKYCSIVPAGEEYVGIEDYVRQQTQSKSTFVRISTSNSASDEENNLIALEMAFVTFIYVMWLHKNHPSVFHGKAITESHHCNHSSIQFLIHPSGKASLHQEYFDAVMQLRSDLKKTLTVNVRDRIEFFNSFFLPEVRRINQQLDQSAQVLLDNKYLQDAWDYFYEALDDNHLLNCRLVNSRERQRLQSENASGRSLIPISTDGWNEPGRDGWILVGGNILGRGLAIPHLVVTLFLRNPRRPNFDTSVQQMRFCGYRKTYIHLVRIFAPDDIIEDYKSAVQIDTIFRKRAYRWHQENRDLLRFPPIMRFVAPLESRYIPTRKSVVSTSVVSRLATSSSGFFRLERIANPRTFSSNLNLIIDMSRGLQEVRREFVGEEEVIFLSLSRMTRRFLFEHFRVHVDEQREIQAMNELMDYSSDERGLSDYDQILAIDRSLLNLVSSENAIGMFEKGGTDRMKLRTLNQAINRIDWIGARPSQAMQHSGVKTVVGEAERRVHKLFSDSTVIHARVFNLVNEGEKHASALGVTLIGWIPEGESAYQVYESEDAARG